MRLRLPPFTVRWVTALVVATYVSIFALVIQVHEVLPSVGVTLNGALDNAWSDLQTITQRPHPYNSHENEVVRTYLLQRVQKLASQYPTVRVEDDLISNATYVVEGRGAFYVEGSNILVKVIGKNASLPAVLFSAHFDSEATAPGATDDGMGVVSLLSLMEQFARNPPLRSAIFNLNNGEEDGLCGSHVFFQHSWAREPSVFLNLEGAGSGGRPILFRASTAQLVKTFQHTGRPHGTVTSSDAYALGLIKSITDFEVYAKEGGMKGLDVSYYTNRDKYHTMGDTVESLNGPRSLWTGLQLTSNVGDALVNLEENDDGDAKAIYWDVLGRRMIVFTFDSFAKRLPRFTTFTTIWIIGLNVVLWYQGSKFSPRREWIHVPASLLSGVTTSTLVAVLYCKVNPLIIYSSTYSVITSIGASIVLSTLLPLRLLHLRITGNPSNLKLLAWSQYFIFMLVIQFGYMLILRKSAFGGFYFLEWLYGGAAFGLILEQALELWRLSRPGGAQASRRFQSEEAADVTEPLLEMSDLRSDGHNSGRREVGHASSQPDLVWTAQFIASVVPSVVLVAPLVLVIASGLGQTIADGSAPALVYAGLTVLLFLCFIPLIPFAHKVPSRFFIIIAILFITSTFYNFVAFPFSKHRRVKFFYTQELDLDTGKNIVLLLGVQPYLKQALGNIPSANTQKVSITWSTDPIRGLGEARWDGISPALAQLLPEPSKSDLQALVESTTRRLGADTAIFTVRGRSTKSCFIKFDQNIINVHVKSSERDAGDAIKNSGHSVGISEHTAYSMPANGVPTVTLWSRTWDAEFEVTVKWNSTDVEGKSGHARFSWRSLLPFARRKGPTYTGRIGCQWADNQEGQMKSLEELFTFLPEWATITTKKALLTADRGFSI